MIRFPDETQNNLNVDVLAKKWLGKLTKLNPATGRGACRGKAPHKPLLLLSILDMVESNEFPTRTFTRSPGLMLRFREYGCIVAERWPTRLDLKMPFYHLSSQGFWEPFTTGMQQATAPDGCAVCDMHPELFSLLADAGFRLKARMVLISKYFEPTERVALFESLGLQSGAESTKAVEEVFGDAVETAKRKGRSARFAVRVAAEYRYTCALTGYQCTTANGSTIVDAAHIEAWAQTQNDELTNGLALSKNAHWMFDEGLWSVDSQMRVIVSTNRFTDCGPEFLRLYSYAGRHLQFDPTAKLRPSQTYLSRHRIHNGFS